MTSEKTPQKLLPKDLIDNLELVLLDIIDKKLEVEHYYKQLITVEERGIDEENTDK